MSDGETYQFSIQCEDTEVTHKKILPLMYEFDNPNLFELIIQFEDKSIILVLVSVIGSLNPSSP